MELTILFPCLNEVETLPKCINRVSPILSDLDIEAEVLIADNGSTDGSIQLAQAMGARVCHVEKKGYGSALREGIQQARGRFVVFADADDSYFIEDFPKFLHWLRHGFDFVIGNRFAGGIEPNAMPWMNRYIGNPVLSSTGRILFGCEPHDLHCGIRGVRKSAMPKLKLSCDGMEFASELVVKAHMANLKVKEIPTGLRPDGRSRKPHLRPFRDGLRHLRFLFEYKYKSLKNTTDVGSLDGDKEPKPKPGFSSQPVNITAANERGLH